MNAPAARARRWKKARLSGAAEREARGARAPRALSNAGSRVRLGITAVVTTVSVMIGGSSVLACPMCFGADETSMVDGTKLGILVMLAVTLAVQGAFVGFFLSLRKRAKRLADVELDTEWSELQRPTRTS